MNPKSTESHDLPSNIQGTMHRKLDPVDLEIIFKGAGSWSLFYAFLQCTKLPCNQVARICYGDINWERKSLRRNIDRVGRSWEMRLPNELLNLVPVGASTSTPLFPSLFCDFYEPELREAQINENLVAPGEYMQALLAAENRPLASLVSFRMTPSTSLPAFESLAGTQPDDGINHLTQAAIRKQIQTN